MEDIGFMRLSYVVLRSAIIMGNIYDKIFDRYQFFVSLHFQHVPCRCTNHNGDGFALNHVGYMSL